jgi:catechol 2,3-dioxygenase-like lactoylglutathione lyase family enzyme
MIRRPLHRECRRRRLFLWFVAIVASIVVARPAAAAVMDIEEISVTVSDLARTEDFYRDGLDFHTVRERMISDAASGRLFGVPVPARAVAMEIGQERVEFVQFQVPGRPYSANSQSSDRWFQHFAIVVGDMDAAYARLGWVHFSAIFEGGLQTLPPETGGVRAFKFRDPDGRPLELLYFPPGRGRTAWAVPPAGNAALGIDHAAIAVASTPASEAFYINLLGMKIAYEQINRGLEQERLDSTFDDMVRITGLRPIRLPNGVRAIEVLDPDGHFIELVR